jgi:hypothetical protein
MRERVSDRAFIADCYQTLLGRPPDGEGLAHYLERLCRRHAADIARRDLARV